MRRNTIQDVLARIDRTAGPDACWPWLGTRSPRGYGKVKFAGRDERVHRLIAAHTMGAIAPDLVVRHACDNPPCCNPAHLLVGTPADNRRDCVERGRWRGNMTRGSQRPYARLTEEDVLQVRRLLPTHSHREIADMFGVGKSTIGSIATGDTWGWLSDDGGEVR
jgi:hypothetical protein